MNLLITRLAALRRPGLTLLAITVGLCAALAGLATPAFASSITGGGNFQMTCNESTNTSSGVVVNETYHIGYVYDGQAPADVSGFFTLNNPDPAPYIHAQWLAEDKCDAKSGQTPNCSGWGVSLDTLEYTDALGNAHRDRLMTNQCTFGGGPPSNEGPGDGSSSANSGSPLLPNGDPAPPGGCNWHIDATASGSGNWLSADVNAIGCGNNLPIFNFACYQNGNLVGQQDDLISPSVGKTVQYQVPAGADSCTLTGYNTTFNNNQLIPLSGYGLPWDPQNGFGAGGWKHKGAGTHAPIGTPQNVHVTAGGLVKWNAVGGAVYYAVQRDGDPNQITFMDAGQTSFQDTVSDGTPHTYQVAAQPDLFPAQQAVWSAEANEPPLNVAYKFGAVSWTGHLGDYDVRYSVLVDGQPGPAWCINVQTVSCSVNGVLADGTQHSVTVEATDPQGNPNSDQTAPVYFVYLNPPGDPTATPGWNSVQLNWTYTLMGKMECYNVYRDGTLIKSGLHTASYIDQPGDYKLHSYRVTESVGSGSESFFSNAVQGYAVAPNPGA